ncbi:MAG: PBP1A family penicillin-binding protein [Acidobacteriota bacterium]|nr:PBP1A family penicillin-binding protein [Acidobacteriota bacterium]
MKAPLAGRPRLVTSLVGATAIAIFLVSGWVAWFSYDLTAGLPDGKALRGLGDMAQATTLYDSDDRVVFTIFKEQRIEVPLDKVSPHFIKAVLSIEDQRFYEHTGVDAIRVAAAVLRNVQAGRRAEGGSTITQQLARQSFLNRDKTYRRKLKEVILAAHLEGVYDKNEILHLYLNKVYFGDGLYGVEAASRGYFGKPAAELEVAEAALLAGLIQSPSSYAPTVNLDRAIARRNLVLSAMTSTGAVNAETAEKAKKSKVKLENGLEIRETYGLYFKEQVRKDLVDRFGWERVYQGGLKVYTTMNSDLQQAAEKLVEKGVVEIESRRGFKYETRKELTAKEGESPAYLQASLVSMDPTTGHVVAMVGGRDFTESRFNRATQAKRQSGSAFKPFVFAAALEAGFSPATVITGLDNPIETLQGKWVPEDEHSTATAMTMRTALKTSSNRAAVQMLNTVGIDKTVGYAEKLNIGTPPSVPSLALGTSDVTLMSLTAAYGAFAAEGVVRPPVLIRKVEDSDGNILYEDEKKSAQAVSKATAYLLSSMLADVVNHGTGYRARQAGFTMPAAGKTGTTNDYLDAWFVGYTPRVVTGVWIGFDQPQTIISNGYAGELAVPMWANYMKVATKGHKQDWFDRPPDVVGVNVCRVSGKRPNDGCDTVEVVSKDGFVESRSMIYTEYFAKGSQPSGICPLHPDRGLLDRIAGVFGENDAPRPVSAEDVGLTPSTPTSTTGASPAARAPNAPPPTKVEEEKKEKKKPGFWGRLLGKGDKKDEKKDPPKKKPGGGF